MDLAILAKELYTPLERIERPVLLVQDGVIASIHQQSERDVPKSRRVLDLEEAILAPGFIETDMTREALAPIREEEQTNACRVLGIPEVIFLRYEDGMLEPSIALRRELTRLIRRHRPDAVLCGDPTVRYYGANYLNHPDHRAAADVTLDAVFPSAGTRLSTHTWRSATAGNLGRRSVAEVEELAEQRVLVKTATDT